MKQICDYKSCTGCMACYNICHQQAITMHSNEEGFAYPVIDEQLCVDCKMCTKVCPEITPVLRKTPLKAYSGWSNDEKVRMDSSSGGAFTEIAQIILRNGGVVFGVAMDKNLVARHIYIEKEQDLPQLQGSKYVQSIIGSTFQDVKDFLENGRIVLFSGTPCQIAGLKNYLRKKYENLITVDIVCHGVPSPKIFEDYKNYLTTIIGNNIRDIKFRCKNSSWIYFNIGVNIITENVEAPQFEYVGNYYSDPYLRAFLRDNILRYNCYNCKYASIQRVSDFTIADWWKYKAENLDDKDFDIKGVSLVLCNSTKSSNIISSLNMNLRERSLEEAIKTNLPLRNSYPMPPTRDLFWKDYLLLGFKNNIKKWFSPDKISLATYLKIYHRNWTIIYHFINIYERIMYKLHLTSFIIKIYAK